jgi:hypothetical protein
MKPSMLTMLQERYMTVSFVGEIHDDELFALDDKELKPKIREGTSRARAPSGQGG